MILPTPLCDSQVLLRQFDQAGVVTVAVGTGMGGAGGLSLRIDNLRAAQVMTRHLLSLGHRHIGFIRGHPRQIDSAQRFDGFVAALRAKGVDRSRLSPRWYGIVWKQAEPSSQENSARKIVQPKVMSSATREMRGKIRFTEKSCISALKLVVAWRARTTP